MPDLNFFWGSFCFARQLSEYSLVPPASMSWTMPMNGFDCNNSDYDLLCSTPLFGNQTTQESLLRFPPARLLSLRDLIHSNTLQHSIEEEACRSEAAGDLGDAFDASYGSCLTPTTGSYGNHAFLDSADAQGLEGQFDSTFLHQDLPLNDPFHAAPYNSAHNAKACWDELLLDEGMDYMSFSDPSGPSKTTDTVFGSLFDVPDGLMQIPSSDGSNGERRYAAGYFARQGVKASTNAKARYECRACPADFGQARDFASPSSRRNHERNFHELLRGGGAKLKRVGDKMENAGQKRKEEKKRKLLQEMAEKLKELQNC
ncbi:uncharacterized protein M421DRAFT_413228 [Didymella exigua CBS 183.55]|uniref:Uncharacterized protein n=1 Tax=Didymella exigua CBS 183.55 TaxID=1150837 RepID=A0A6A5R5K8_9PLEO|nr:uncharacterized protein M421DRAFT_413228 [Didymella exigua CBS 183.55]KAF1922284.1 hypothetical protein M421DRAFT_413228 [Didymella exigua CBS 183.55]